MSWILGALLACQELEANSLDTLRMTACGEARTRGKNVVVVCTRPTRLTSMQSRMEDTSALLAVSCQLVPDIPARTINHLAAGHSEVKTYLHY